MKTHSHSKFGEDEPADGLHAVFASLLEQNDSDEPATFYVKACECIGEKTGAEPKDIMAFSGGLKPYRSKPGAGWKAGLFISALINHSRQPHFVLEPSGIGQPLDYIGFRNDKNLVVIGNAGGRLGWEMSGGSIYVDGDAGHEAGGRMTDGTVWVQGDAGERAGCGQAGGLLHVRGQAGKDAGQDRQGGTILIGATAKTQQCLGAVKAPERLPQGQRALGAPSPSKGDDCGAPPPSKAAIAPPASRPAIEPKAVPLPASAVIGEIEEVTAPVYHAPLEGAARAPPQDPQVHYPAANARRGGSSLYVEAGVKSAKDR